MDNDGFSSLMSMLAKIDKVIATGLRNKHFCLLAAGGCLGANFGVRGFGVLNIESNSDIEIIVYFQTPVSISQAD